MDRGTLWVGGFEWRLARCGRRLDRNAIGGRARHVHLVGFLAAAVEPGARARRPRQKFLLQTWQVLPQM
jgi:hypothetical protein